ncbi:hypothetical protein MRX96_021683 [Rhipicephalus microplus]
MVFLSVVVDAFHEEGYHPQRRQAKAGSEVKVETVDSQWSSSGGDGGENVPGGTHFSDCTRATARRCCTRVWQRSLRNPSFSQDGGARALGTCTCRVVRHVPSPRGRHVLPASFRNMPNTCGLLEVRAKYTQPHFQADGPPQCSRGIVRVTATRVLMSATEALQTVNPSPADLQVTLNDLQGKDTTLADFNEKIADLIIGDAEYDEELTAALEYRDKIYNIMSRVRYNLNSISRPTDSNAPVVTTAASPKKSPLKEVPYCRCELPYRSYRYPFFSGELREWQGF